MKRPLTLLFITKDIEHQVERSSFYLANELKKHTNLLLWHDHGDMTQIIEQLPIKPDFILLNDFKPIYSPFIRNLSHSPIPYGIIMHDLKYKIPQRKQWIKQEKIKHIFSIYRDSFKKWYPEFMDRMMWLPHHAPINIFKDHGLEKHIDLLMSGAIFQHIYPLRYKMHTFFHEKDHRYRYISHPGYRNIRPGEENVFVGTDYAQVLNQTKLFLTCDSIEHFPVLKYFEASASGACVLAPLNQELIDLGFEDSKNIIEINEVNFKSKVEYYLNHSYECDIISRNAMKLIHDEHSTAIRAQQLLNYIRKII